MRRIPGTSNRSRRQQGFTLLEVVLSMTIFFGSIAMLAQINWNATRAAVQSRMRAQAILRCESKLQEVIAGAVALSDQSNVAFEDDKTWTWSLTTGATNFPELITLEVTVSREAEGTLGSTSQTLRRWVRDPYLFEQAATAAEDAATTSSTTGSAQ
jgi:general secretion pathway protein I